MIVRRVSTFANFCDLNVLFGGLTNKYLGYGLAWGLHNNSLSFLQSQLLWYYNIITYWAPRSDLWWVDSWQTSLLKGSLGNGFSCQRS